MNSAASLGPRPSNPADISFAPECFAQGPVRIAWGVCKHLRNGGTKEFATREEAERFAAPTGHPVFEIARPTQLRIRWS